MSGLQRRDRLHLAVELPLRVPQVIGLLHADPQIGTVAAELADAHSHLRRNPGLLREHAVQLLARDTQMLRHLGDGDAQSGQHILAQDGAGVRRRPLRTMGSGTCSCFIFS